MVSLSPLMRGLTQRFRGAKTYAKIALIRVRHQALLAGKRKRTRLRVVFVVLTESTWKLETLLREMEADPAFDPAIAVAEMQTLDETTRQAEYENAMSYFRARDPAGTVLRTPREIAGFDPDIVFLTNPHFVTDPAFHFKLMDRYLCCYVPYHLEVGSYDDNQAQYNQFFHNAMWRIFAPHEVSRKTFREVSLRRGENVVVTGYPACEPLLEPAGSEASVWKRQDRDKLRLIWAPHHSIDMPQLPYANFLRYAEAFVALADRYRDRVQWAFKPHPLLRSKLYRHPDWGRERTDAYFGYWAESGHCQLELGSYVDLFRQSDAMIHDSGSFLAEYLYLDKPVMFLQSVENIADFLNDFGLEAYRACEHARRFEEVESFVRALADGSGRARREADFARHPEREAFYERNIAPHFLEAPSRKIARHIKSHFPALRGGQNG